MITLKVLFVTEIFLVREMSRIFSTLEDFTPIYRALPKSLEEKAGQSIPAGANKQDSMKWGNIGGYNSGR